MEPAIILENVGLIELLEEPTASKSPPPHPKPRGKKRRKNRRALFSNTKTKHTFSILRPFEPAHSDYFCGFDNASTNVPSDFCGFSDKEMYASKREERLHPLNAFDLDFEFNGKVSSVGLEKHASYEHLLMVKPITKRHIRVLSLFDGIATGLHVLDVKLNLNVEAYFSSEIDKHALRLQCDRWHGKLVQIGDVRSISEETLCALGRIDLVIGGSPCNELSLVNWRRRGLFDPESSGHLFFNFVNIRNFLQRKMAACGLPFFWMFENTHHMENETRDAISHALDCDPITCCASSFLPVVRSRNFWGNIPGMNDRTCTSKEESTSMNLQDILRPHRTANFKISKTITTNKSNLKKGGKMPVTMAGKQVNLNINEIEMLMGMPMHYTDACDLTVKQRSKLLAKGWCVPVVQKIMQPLSEMYFEKSSN